MAAAEDLAVGLEHDELDVTDLRSVRAAVADLAPDAVINCAAWTDVDGAEAHESRAESVNVGGAANVARAAAEVGATIVHVSTDFVFDGARRTPYVESDHPAPLGAYGRTKLAGERAVAAANPRHHIVRSSWLFGGEGRNFVTTILGLARERERISVVDDQVGCPTYTPHLAEALVEIAGREQTGIWHVTGSGTASWHELAGHAVALAGLDCEVAPVKTAEVTRPAPRPAYSVLGTERVDTPRLPAWPEALGNYLGVTT
ncbi:MAG: dTDP-4-dehydrorhamnose reductase [Solirubrobacteraceae bacterium]|jgi:dTDP-4-dehydrorhamnose reductase|nr:dTDP-4-dehydrorhamnose reductase [Solirubrobacteraceae bacterium]